MERVRQRAWDAVGTPTLTFDPALVRQVAERAAGVEIGARAIEQIIARELLPLLSRHFLERTGEGGFGVWPTHVQLSDTGRFRSWPKSRRRQKMLPSASSGDDVRVCGGGLSAPPDLAIPRRHAGIQPEGH